MDKIKYILINTNMAYDLRVLLVKQNFSLSLLCSCLIDLCLNEEYRRVEGEGATTVILPHSPSQHVCVGGCSSSYLPLLSKL